MGKTDDCSGAWVFGIAILSVTLLVIGFALAPVEISMNIDAKNVSMVYNETNVSADLSGSFTFKGPAYMVTAIMANSG